MRKRILFSLLCLVACFSLSVPNIEAASTSNQEKITQLTKQVKDLKTKVTQKSKENTELTKEIKQLDLKINNLENKFTSFGVDMLDYSVSSSKFSEHKTASRTSTSKDKKKLAELTKQGKDLTKKLKQETNKNVELKSKKKVLSKQISELESKLNQLTQASIIYTDSLGEKLPSSTDNSIKWFGFKTEMTTVYLTPNAYKEVGYIIDITDDILEEIGSYFGTSKLPREVPVFIWFNDYVNKTSRGEYFSKEKRIFINARMYAPFNREADNGENFISVYSHEFTHAYQDNYQNFNSIRDKFQSEMTWLNEGVANYINNQYMDYSKYTLPNGQLTMKYKRGKDHYKNDILAGVTSANKKVEDLKQLLDNSFFRGYAPAESMIYFIEVTYGHDKFLDFIEGLRTQSINDSMIKNFGVTEAQFIEEWKKYFVL